MTDKSNTRHALLHAAKAALPPTAGHDAEILLAETLGLARSDLYAWPERTVTTAQQAQFADRLRRRAEGEPIAYILGHQPFWSLDLLVTRDTFIPRPETELAVETVLSLCQASESLALADLGTGTGAIALALAKERPDWDIIATDKSAVALEVAQRNAQRHGIENVRFYLGDGHAALPKGAFAAIVSNPPYIADHDAHLDPAVRRFEPPAALFAGPDGLDVIRRIIPDAKARLIRGGPLVLEHGFDQAGAVSTLMRAAGFRDVTPRLDLAGHPRVTHGRC